MTTTYQQVIGYDDQGRPMFDTMTTTPIYSCCAPAYPVYPPPMPVPYGVPPPAVPMAMPPAYPPTYAPAYPPAYPPCPPSTYAGF